MKQRAIADNNILIYPDICFVFNRNIIRVMTECSSMTLTLSNGDDIYTDKRVNTNYADISPYLQMFFDRDEIADGGNIKDISVNVRIAIDPQGQMTIDEDLDIKAIWGAMNIGEKLVGWKKARWFKNFPYDLSFYIPENTGYIFKGENGGNFANKTDDLPKGFAKIDKDFFNKPLSELNTSQLSFLRDKESYFDDTFDVTFWDKSWVQFQINIVFDERTCGRYLRWVDRQGFLRYYLFQEISTTLTTEEKSNEFAIDYEDEEYAYYGASRTLGKKTTKTMNAAAPFLDKDEREYVQTLLSAPLVWEYIDEKWIPVRISAGTYTSPNDEKKPLQHIEIQIQYPEIISQNL